MTTGRINQVTGETREGSGPGVHPATPPARLGSLGAERRRLPAGGTTERLSHATHADSAASAERPIAREIASLRAEAPLGCTASPISASSRLAQHTDDESRRRPSPFAVPNAHRVRRGPRHADGKWPRTARPRSNPPTGKSDEARSASSLKLPTGLPDAGIDRRLTTPTAPPGSLGRGKQARDDATAPTFGGGQLERAHRRHWPDTRAADTCAQSPTGPGKARANACWRSKCRRRRSANAERIGRSPPPAAAPPPHSSLGGQLEHYMDLTRPSDIVLVAVCTSPGARDVPLVDHSPPRNHPRVTQLSPIGAC